MTLGSLLGACVLLLAPGSWLTFWLPLRGNRPTGLATRLVLGFALSPAVVFVQFLLLRAAGATFEATSLLLVVLNLPPLVLLLRRWRGAEKASAWSRSAALWTAAVLVLAFGVLLTQWWPDQYRAWGSGHSWVRAAVIDSLAAGDVPPEERQVAGLRLAYPWAFMVQQATFSFVAGAPHQANVMGVNLLWLVAVAWLVARLLLFAGVSARGVASALACLLFGPNLLGIALRNLAVVEELPWRLVGDGRYTPWLLKFLGSTPMIAGLGLCAALLWALTRADRHGASWAALVFLLVGSTGVLYPLLLPAAGGFVAAALLAEVVDRGLSKEEQPWGRYLAEVTAVGLAGAVSLAHLEWVTRDRTEGSMLFVSAKREMLRKVVEDGIVLFPLLLALALAFGAARTRHRRSALTWGIAAASSIFLNVAFSIPGYQNEYKYVFTAALALAPFVGLAVDTWSERLPRAAPGVALAVCAVMWGQSLAVSLAQRPTLRLDGVPQLDLGAFHLRVDDGEPLAPLVDAIQTRSPDDAVLVIDRWELFWPILVHRATFVSPAEKSFLVGTNVPTDLQIKTAGGYGSALIEDRREVVTTLMSSPDEAARRAALAEIQALGRPLIVLAELPRHAAVLEWLAATTQGAELARAANRVAWQIPAPAAGSD